MKYLWVLVALALSPASAVTVKTKSCAGGVEAARIRVDVRRSPDGPVRSLSHIKRIEKGTRILYKPVELPADIKNSAKVALAVGNDEAGLVILEFKPAATPAEWSSPIRANIAVFVLGPQGLDEKRVTTLVNKDEELLSALADYADQTLEIEDTVEALTALDAEEENVIDPTRLDRNNPSEQALYTLLRALNPTLLANNPMGGGKRMGPVTLMNKASVGFFENAGGLFPGGGALTEIKPMLLPDSDFRAAFAQQAGENLVLCVPRLISKSRNRQVYLWARRIIDADAPSFTAGPNRRLPIGARTQLPLASGKANTWRYMDRIEHWKLQPVNGGEAVPVRAKPAWQGRNLEIDLRGFPGKAGFYKLRGEWDWDTVIVNGDIELAPLADLKQARVAPVAADSLIAGTGVSKLTLENADFQFIDRVTLRPLGGQQELAQPLQFVLPAGRRSGVQQQLDIDVDTRTLRAGPYLLAMQQADGRSQEMPLQILSNTIQLEGLPIRMGSGNAPQLIVIKGAGVDKVAQLEIANAEVTLEPRGRLSNQRTAKVTLKNANKGDRLDLIAQLEGSPEKRRFTAAIEVLGPRPRIVSAKTTLPVLGTTLKDGELPVGQGAGVSLQIESADPVTATQLTCNGDVAAPAVTSTGAKSIYFTAIAGSACTLAATVETADGLRSDAFAIGRAVRVPRIDSIAFSGDKNTDGTYAATLTGESLEAIEKTGWSAANGSAVTELPAPLGNHKQTLRIAMPWPSPAPKAPLFIWLRGEAEGRSTTTRY